MSKKELCLLTEESPMFGMEDIDETLVESTCVGTGVFVDVDDEDEEE